MSDPFDRDVLDKADALLRRHAGAGEDATPVPVLTDLVDPGIATDPPAPADAVSALSGEVFQRVMTRVEERLAADLERRLAHHLAVQSQAVIAAALSDLRPELAATIRDAIAEALQARQVK